MPERITIAVTSDIEIDTSSESDLNKDDPVGQETIQQAPRTTAGGTHYQYEVTVLGVQGGAGQAAKARLSQHGYEVNETQDADQPLHVSGLT